MTTTAVAPPHRADAPAANGRTLTPPRGLLLLLAATAVLWVVGLSRSGWANAFYSAAVQAGTQSWKAFLFGSSDAANSITVDKPPASLWPMEISARIFGLNSWSILLPEVLFGLASVALLYVIVKRHFGYAAGLIAGAALALTPVATLMFRYNNPDAMLVFLMIAAAWAITRAVDDGRTRWLVLCGGLLGLGFLTKQLQVLLVMPGLGLAYLAAGPRRTVVRVGQLAAGLAAAVVAAGWWVFTVEVWPAEDRPYIGGSKTNSFLDLTFGYNGFGRLTGNGTAPPGMGGSEGAPRMPFGQTGIARMFTGESGGQIGWLLPAALILLVVGLILCGRAVRTDARRAQYLIWGGWLLVTAAVFSFMSGLFHDYYTVALAPAVTAVVGIGTAHLWERRESRWATPLLALIAALTAAWAWVLLGRTPDFVPWLRWLILAVGAVAATGLLLARKGSHDPRRWFAALAVAAALAGPLAYCIQTVSTSHTGGIVTAGPSIAGSGFAPPGVDGGGHGGPPAGMGVVNVTEKVVSTLSADYEDYTWIAAASGSSEAAEYQLATGHSVMPLGGFSSGDPSPTLQQFENYVAEGRIHYYIDSGAAEHRSDNDQSQAQLIRAWVEARYSPLNVDGVTLYELS